MAMCVGDGTYEESNHENMGEQGDLWVLGIPEVLGSAEKGHRCD